MKSFFVFAVVCVGISFAQAASIPVAPTGSCSGDLSAFQSAVDNAQPGDVVQLGAGSYDFSCVASNTSGVVISHPDITVQGLAGQTILNGPGFANQSISTGLFVAADAVTLDSLTLRGFYTAVQAGRGPSKANSIAITNSTFHNNIQSVFVAQDTVAPRLIGNTFSVPTPPSSDIFGPFGEATAVIVNRHCSYFLFARNTVTGPGVVVQFQNTAQLVADPHATNEGLHTIGLLQADFSGDVAELGRVSENTFTGLDSAMQSSSNLGIVSHNTATNNAIGIVISNDFDDGVHQVTGNIVTENVSSGNQVGIWIASGTQNSITLNDLRNNSLAGLLFMANPGGAASTGNRFHQDQGANIVGAAGNSSF
jgi:hypothetical protein